MVLGVLLFASGLALGWWARGQGIVVPVFAPTKSYGRAEGNHEAAVTPAPVPIAHDPAVRSRMIEDFTRRCIAVGNPVDATAIAGDVDRILREVGG